MKLTQECLNFEKFSQKLIGMTIIKVEYSEINYAPTNPKPNYSTKYKNLDSVDYSIFLHTDNNKLVEIYWDDKFFQFGIGIKINEQSDFSGNIKWNVSTNELWEKFLGKNIVDINITWEMVITTDEKTRKTKNFIYPQDIKITFSNGKNLFISVAGFLDQNDEEVYGMLDNLTVTDNEELAKQVKMIN